MRHVGSSNKISGDEPQRETAARATGHRLSESRSGNAARQRPVRDSTLEGSKRASTPQTPCGGDDQGRGVDTTELNGGRERSYSMTVVRPDLGISTDTARDEYVLSIKDLLGVLWRRLWAILLVTVVLSGTVVGLDLLRTPTYEATIKVLVGQKQMSEVPGSLAGDVQGLQQLTQTMAEVLPTRPVAEAVISRLDLELSPEELLENLSVEQVDATQVIEVSYEDENRERAKQIADTVGTVFSKQVSEVSPSTNAITATVWEEAALPDSPASPNPLRDGLLALILGSMLGLGLAFLLEILDDPWRSPEEVERVSGVPTFSVIPEFRLSKSKKGGN